MLKILKNIYLLFLFSCASIFCKDVFIEFKGACFLPTNSCVRNIYGKAGPLYGPELTFQLCENKNWYGFASLDFLTKNGRSIGLCDRTKMHLMPLGLGLKYFVPFCFGDFYMGLGFQPVLLKTINCSNFVLNKTSNWAFGGVAKMGSCFDLCDNYFLDIFADYSFAKLSCKKRCYNLDVINVKANISGAVIGAGIGYRF